MTMNIEKTGRPIKRLITKEAKNNLDLVNPKL